MMKRPALKPGDLCRLSKRTRKYGYGRDIKSIVVDAVQDSDSTDGYARILCIVVSQYGTRTHWSRCTYRRKELWFTGYNVNTEHKPKHMHDEPTVKVEREHKPPTTKAVDKICVCYLWEGRTVWDPCICGAMDK